MPCNYRNEAKAKFPLPEYPQEGQFNIPVWYERAVKQFSTDHEVVTDTMHASEAAQLKVEEVKSA